MERVIRKVTIDLSEAWLNQPVVLQKGTNYATIEFYLMNAGRRYDATLATMITVRAKKPDGTIIDNACKGASDRVYYDVTPNTLSAAGVVECQLNLYDERMSVLYSPKFNIAVKENVYDDGEITSTNEFTVFQTYMSGLDDLKEKVETKLEALEAEYGDLESKAEELKQATDKYKADIEKELNALKSKVSELTGLKEELETAIGRAETMESNLNWWFGTKAEYNALDETGKTEHSIYFIEEGT